MRVVLIDDHLMFRESFRIALEAQTAFRVVGEAATAQKAYEAVEREKPDLLVADFLLKDTDGVSLVRELKRRKTLVSTLMLTRVSHELFVSDAFEAGVKGYALKDQPFAEITEAMERVSSGQRYLSPTLGRLDAVVPRSSVSNGDSGRFDRLSHREREIFFRVVEGLSNKEIAGSLCISVKTVETHRLQINRKLGVRSPLELMRLAAIQGLVRDR